jgi:hypothetical protein
MFKAMSLMIVGIFLLTWVFAHNIAVWNPETWGLGPSEYSTFANMVMAAVFTCYDFLYQFI